MNILKIFYKDLYIFKNKMTNKFQFTNGETNSQLVNYKPNTLST